MATPFPFTQGQVLTAAQMNAITELVVNDKTASYTLVAGDAGERVIMNSASATTITVNTSIFTAGQLVHITNKGAGICTVTAGTATVSTTGSLALAQFGSGVLYCISAGVFIFEAYGVAASASGLTFITGASFTAAATVSLPNDTFTATYDNYRIIMDVTDISATQTITARLRASGADNTTANYNTTSMGIDTAGTARNLVGNAQTSFNFGGVLDGATTQDYYSFSIDVISPKLARFTEVLGTLNWSAASFFAGNYYAANFATTTAFDAMSWIVAGGATITGNYRVYGYANS